MSGESQVIPPDAALPLTDEERIAAIANYEGSFSDMEKLALETLARTARDPLFCFELSVAMMRLRAKLGVLRAGVAAERKKARGG